jgi:predicted nucleotidyltransferase
MKAGEVAIESALRAFFDARSSDVATAYLFGSVARETARPDSDVDVAVLLRRSPPPTLEGLQLDMASDLEEVLGRSVDLVVLNGAPPDLVHRVLRDGRPIADADPSARIAFEVRARNEYFDILPHLERYRRPRP